MKIIKFFIFVSLFVTDLSLISVIRAEEKQGASVPDSQVTQTLSEVVVSSIPIEKTLFETAQPVTILSEKDLEANAGKNLGQILSSEPGIAFSNFGPGVGRPVIRGLGGDRIKILENGLDSQDVSNTSPDHAIAVDPFVAEKVEVMRGPAALLYGTSAIGGIVNVLDNRILDTMPDSPLEGKVRIQGSTADIGREAGISLNAPAGPFALHVDGFKKRTDDIDIPGFARTQNIRDTGSKLDYPEPKGKLPFSYTESDNGTVGASYITDKGFFGASINNYNSIYGVPNGENNISIDQNRKRADFRGKVYDPSDVISSVDIKLGLNDYDHVEYEGTEAGTKFSNDGADTRIEIKHKSIGGGSNGIGALEGLGGFQFKRDNFKAVGLEAFQPQTVTLSSSGFLFEEMKLLDSLRIQAGARLDYTTLDSEGFDMKDKVVDPKNRNYPTLNGSTGLVYTPFENYTLALSVARTERAPSGQELFANGPHVATGAYEIGNSDF